MRQQGVVVVIDRHFPTISVGMKSSEPKYNTKHLFLDLAVAFFSVW